MGVTVTGAEELRYLLKQAGQKAVKGAIDQMRKEAQKIADLARQMAPVDEGDLEKAIIVTEEGGGRDSSGRFARKQLSVGVDMDAPAGFNKRGEQITVGAYAYVMHEHLAPFGKFGLGPLSRLKQSRQSVMVGGKYLERALAEIEPGLINRVVLRVKRELAGNAPDLDDFED